MPIPDLTPEQRKAAIEKAAKARKERTELKHRITTMSLPELLAVAESDEGTLGAMKVSALLEALPTFDRGAAMRIMERLAIPMSCRVRALGSRQRAALEREAAKEQTSLLLRRERVEREQAESTVEISLEPPAPRHPVSRSITGASDLFHLKVPWRDRENVIRALRESGTAPFIEGEDGVQHAISNVPEFAVVLVAASSGAWLCIRAVIKGLAERNRYKTFRFTLPNGAKLEADGHSDDQLAAIVRLASEQYAEHLADTGNSHDLRQALARAARELVNHRENWPADEEIDFYFKQAAKVLDDPGGQGKLPKWVASAVERIRELNQDTGEDAERVLDEVTKLLAQLAAQDPPREQRG